ncbi:MAG: nucleotidyltransferase domain-containing protein [Blastocatellia bacterium]
MTIKAASKSRNENAISRKAGRKDNIPSSEPTLPDLSWYSDIANRRKRLAHIERLCERIAREFEPEKIVLFGSQAYGNPTDDSDIDLLVVMPYSGSPLRKAGEILSQLQIWMPVDLIVRSAEDIEQRLWLGDRFMREVLDRGKVMYEAANR